MKLSFMLKAILSNTLSIYQYCFQVQLNKQNISALKRKNSDNLEEIRPNENTNRINARWTNDEILLAVQGVRKYGKDFQVSIKNQTNIQTIQI